MSFENAYKIHFLNSCKMKKILATLVAATICITAFCQDITGTWNGVLKVQAMQLRLVFNISKTDNGYSATMDSPDQGAKGIPVTTVSFENAKLQLKIDNAGILYEGLFEKDSIVGTFKQGGLVVPMNLSRKIAEKQKVFRPQEPLKPYAYYEEEVTFENRQAGITLAGTLTLPKKEGRFPVVVLISGSGPQNRDEELFGHKPFLVLADYLTKNGIAVLRYDDRGTASSKGDFNTATTYDLSTDAEAAVEYLKTRKEINKKQIGLIGHSEGGMIAPMLASRSKDIAYIVMLAGPGVPIEELLHKQQELIGKASGMSDENIQKTGAINKGIYELIKQSNDPEKLKTDLTAYLQKVMKEDTISKRPEGMSDEDIIRQQVSQIANPWMSYFVKYDPAVVLRKVKCPVLAINGEKDLQVSPKENLEAIRIALSEGKNKKSTIKSIPGLNHVFQTCETGSPMEYGKIEETFSPVAMAEVLNWIKKEVK